MLSFELENSFATITAAFVAERHGTKLDVDRILIVARDARSRFRKGADFRLICEEVLTDFDICDSEFRSLYRSALGKFFSLCRNHKKSKEKQIARERALSVFVPFIRAWVDTNEAVVPVDPEDDPLFVSPDELQEYLAEWA